MSILHPEAMVKQIVRREAELENKRTRSLARQQWADVIECEAALAECRKLRTWIANEAVVEVETKATNFITITHCPKCKKATNVEPSVKAEWLYFCTACDLGFN